MGMGYGYASPVKKPAATNPLTDEEVKYLAQKNPTFSLSVTKEEQLQAICTHRDKAGNDKLRRNNDGTVTCMICGATFRVVDTDQENIDAIFTAATDALETMKVMYVDVPDEVCKAYFQMIPFLKKGKQMYKIASDHFGQYGSALNPANYGGGNAAMLLNGMLGGFGTSMYNMQMMNQPGQVNMYGGMGMPQQNPAMGAPMQMGEPVPTAAPGVNVFDAGATAPESKPVEQNTQYQL